jgi:tRNA A-37 threonylcarbamoyl transferase component Bud32
MDDSEPEVRDLFTTYGNDGSDFEHLLDVGGIRYHLLLRYNTAEPECLENMTLDVLYNSCSLDDEKATNDAVDDCLGVLWPFLQSDYRLQTGVRPDKVVKLQVLTTNGVLHSQYHDHYLEYPRAKAIENCFPGVAVYTSSQVERLNELEMDIFKVRLHGSILCMKTIYRTSRESSFIREVSTLQSCTHPNIIQLIGLVTAENQEDKVEGMLIEYVENAQSLRDLPSISAEECERWTSQITDAVEYLHQKGLVWGDAKAGNVLVRRDGNVVLIDFGGGYTDGWVDMNNQDTARGDLQGLERIIMAMKAKVKVYNRREGYYSRRSTNS